MPFAALEQCTCREAGDRVSELLDGELGECDRARILLHLAVCSGCARYAKELARTVREIRGLAEVAGGPAGRRR